MPHLCHWNTADAVLPELHSHYSTSCNERVFLEMRLLQAKVQIANHIPKFWSVLSCISRAPAKTSGYSFSRDNPDYAEYQDYQDLSVAGARAGLAGERSGLFMEQTRIVNEMRAEDERRGRTAHAIRPRYMVWENVPGAFSSGEPKGEDFRIVLEEICRIKSDTVYVPRPERSWEPVGLQCYACKSHFLH